MKNPKSVYRLKQLMCALLVCVMTISLLPVSVFALPGDAGDTAPTVTAKPAPPTAPKDEPTEDTALVDEEAAEPQGTATRAELAQILMNFHKSLS